MLTRKKKTLGSYPFMTVIASLTLALVIIGMVVVLGLQGNRLVTAVKSRFEVQVFLHHDLTPLHQDSLKAVFANQPWIAKLDDKAQVRFVSKEQAAKRFMDETGEDFANLLGDNPLRDAYQLRIDATYADSVQLSKLAQQVRGMDGVYEVVYEPDLLQNINANLNKIFAALGGVSLLLIAGVILLIHNTIRLAMYSQRFLIRSMQLVGASVWFIQRPFLARAAIHSMIATVVAFLTIWALGQTAASQVVELSNISQAQDYLFAGAAQLFTGLIIGLGSAWRAIHKYLGMSLDQLY